MDIVDNACRDTNLSKVERKETEFPICQLPSEDTFSAFEVFWIKFNFNLELRGRMVRSHSYGMIPESVGSYPAMM